MLPRLHADDRIKGILAVDQLIVGLLGIKEGVRDDARLLKKLDRPVDGGLGDAVSPGSHLPKEGVNLKESIEFQDCIKNVSAFRRVLEIPGSEESPKDTAEGREDLNVID